MFRHSLRAGPQAFIAWALLGGLVVYGTVAVMVSAPIVYAGSVLVARGLIRDTAEWRDVLGFGAGAGVFLLAVATLAIGYEACTVVTARCAGVPAIPHLVTGAALAVGSFATWSLRRRGTSVRRAA